MDDSGLHVDIRSLHVLFAHSEHLPLCRLVNDTFVLFLKVNHKVVQQQFTGEVKTLNNLLASSFLSLSRTNNY